MCLRIMTYVTHTGGASNDLWRFDTSKDVWEAVDNKAVNGEPPGERTSHVMTSVGQDLWLHGGSTSGTYVGDAGEGDGCSAPTVLLLLHRGRECDSLYLQ